MGKPAWTDKVEKGMWLIVSRSATVMAAELGETFLGKEDTQAVLAASRYADYHWSKHRDADVLGVERPTKKREMPRQSKAGETEGGSPANPEGPEGGD